ncbi:MAG: RNA recognition motif domain-containing protein [Vicinamibacterales bacterium]
MTVRLFVGNLPYQATEADLRAHFSPVSAPTHVVMPVDRETGRPRGFAFVDFPDRPLAEEVIRRFDGQPFGGRVLAISEARGREDRGSAPRPPGGGFSRMPSSFSRPGVAAPAPDAAPQRPARTFGPDAPPKGRQRAMAKRKTERGPRGPIKERPTSRLFDVDEDLDEGLEEFDNPATSEDSDETFRDPEQE